MRRWEQYGVGELSDTALSGHEAERHLGAPPRQLYIRMGVQGIVNSSNITCNTAVGHAAALSSSGPTSCPQPALAFFIQRNPKRKVQTGTAGKEIRPPISLLLADLSHLLFRTSSFQQ